MKRFTSHPKFILTRLVSLLVVEVFLCSSTLQVWALPPDFLRPRSARLRGVEAGYNAADGGQGQDEHFYETLSSYQSYLLKKAEGDFIDGKTLVTHLHNLREEELAALTEYVRGHFQEDKGRQLAQRVGILTKVIVENLLTHYRTKSNLPDEQKQVVLLAGGSYGRKEMTRTSDLELTLLEGPQADRDFVKKLSKEIVKNLEAVGFHEVGIYQGHYNAAPLLGTLGQSTIDLVNLLESRLIAGDESLYEDFQNRRQQFVAGLTPEQKQRHLTFEALSRFPQSGLEKERAGDRRDLMRLIWLAFLAGETKQGLYQDNIGPFEEMTDALVGKRTLSKDERDTLLLYLDQLLWASHLTGMQPFHSIEREDEWKHLVGETEVKRIKIARILSRIEKRLTVGKVDQKIRQARYSSSVSVVSDLYEAEAAKRDWPLLAALASNPVTPPEILGDLVARKDYASRDLRFYVAMNPATPLWLLVTLSQDELGYIREQVKRRLDTEWSNKRSSLLDALDDPSQRLFQTEEKPLTAGSVEIGERRRVALIEGRPADGKRDILGEGYVLVVDPEKVKIVSWVNEKILDEDLPADTLPQLMQAYPEKRPPGVLFSKIVQKKRRMQSGEGTFLLIHAMNSLQSNFWQPLGFLITDGKLRRKAEGKRGLSQLKYEPLDGDFSVFVVEGERKGIQQVTIKNNELVTKGIVHAISGPPLVIKDKDVSSKITEVDNISKELEARGLLSFLTKTKSLQDKRGLGPKPSLVPDIRHWEPGKVNWTPRGEKATQTSFAAIGLTEKGQIILLSMFGNTLFGGKDPFYGGPDVQKMAVTMKELGAKDALLLGGSQDVGLWTPELPSVRQVPPRENTRRQIKVDGGTLRPDRPLNAAILIYAPESPSTASSGKEQARDGGTKTLGEIFDAKVDSGAPYLKNPFDVSAAKARGIAAIVLNAGEGKRMRPDLKQTFPFLGKPMGVWPLLALQEAGIPTMVVVGHEKEKVKEAFEREIPELSYVEQKEPFNGTAEAALSGVEALGDYDGPVLVMNGDAAAIDGDFIQWLKKSLEHTSSHGVMVVYGAKNPHGLGRVIERGGEIVAVVEQNVIDNEKQIAAAGEIFSRETLNAIPLVYSGFCGFRNARELREKLRGLLPFRQGPPVEYALPMVIEAGLSAEPIWVAPGNEYQLVQPNREEEARALEEEILRRRSVSDGGANASQDGGVKTVEEIMSKPMFEETIAMTLSQQTGRESGLFLEKIRLLDPATRNIVGALSEKLVLSVNDRRQIQEEVIPSDELLALYILLARYLGDETLEEIDTIELGSDLDMQRVKNSFLDLDMVKDPKTPANILQDIMKLMFSDSQLRELRDLKERSIQEKALERQV